MRSRITTRTMAILWSCAFLGTIASISPTQSFANPIASHASSMFPSWMATAAASGVAGVGAQGWGPGAAGISVQYLYNPYANTLAAALLSSMRRGRVITSVGYVASGNLSQGGAAHPILTFRDGTSVSVDRAVQIPAKSSRSASVQFPAGTVYYVNATSISDTGVEKDSSQHVFCFVDTSGAIKSLWLKIFSASTSMAPEIEYPAVHPRLHQLSTESAIAYVVAGNDGTHLFQRTLSTQTMPTDFTHLLHALANATVLQTSMVRSTEYGFRSPGRIHDKRLSIELQNGDKVDINAGYGLVKSNASVRTNPDLFRVTMTNPNGTTSVFVQDHSGVIHQAWLDSTDQMISSTSIWPLT